MPLIETRGAGSAQGFGEFAQSAAVNYIEDVFSTYVYTGSGTSKTITNGIDLSGKGGLVWTKMRSSPVSNAHNHRLSDSAIGVNQVLSSNNTDPKTSSASFGISSFNSDGYTITNPGSNGGWNHTNDTFVSWTFRKQAKFFDVVTYTGDGVSGRTVAHSLGSVPGCIIVKNTSDGTRNWAVYHRSLGGTQRLILNTTDAATGQSSIWNDTNPTSTVFTVGNNANTNASGATYVAYLFAHDAGGFGLSGSDNVISCGSYTGNGSSTGPTITLGYEPQWVMVKRSDSAANWFMLDIMRGIPNTPGIAAGSAYLFPNLSDAEDSAFAPFAALSATGFSLLTSNANLNASGGTYIYIAIRRGPMKVPTSGTSVFSPNSSSGAAGTDITTNFPADVLMAKYRPGAGSTEVNTRLTGFASTDADFVQTLRTASTDAEATANDWANTVWNTGFKLGSTLAGLSTIYYGFRRAPGFFDVVCYTGNGTYGATNHNLGVIPELTIYKKRSGTSENWGALYYLSSISYRFGNLNLTDAFTTYSNDPAVAGLFSSTQFCKYYDTSGQTYVAYLFATLAGVSKVGSYTGTGTTKQIDCGFTGGARFVLIKRTDSTGDWYVWDSARGIVASTDPYLVLNSTAAEVTTTDWVDTYSAGFELSSAAGNNVNINTASYIFLSIA